MASPPMRNVVPIVRPSSARPPCPCRHASSDARRGPAPPCRARADDARFGLGAVGQESPAGASGPGALQPTVQYQEAVAHAGDRIPFTAGGRVTVPFKPRSADRWAVGGVRPRELPAGRLSGQAMRAPTPPGPPIRNDPPAAPGDAVGAVDAPYVDPASAPMAELAAAVDPGGLKREVFGFLPYWELTDSSTRLDWEKLSTVAYFGVGVAANGDLQKTNSDGSTTVGWGGWTSSTMTRVMNNAHASGGRVVLTVQSFAWTSAGVTRQRSLLGSAANRANLARQIAAAVRDRGADGVNLDFEPIISTYSDEFTALVRSVRAELNKIARGYQLTFDATGWIGNYPIGDATRSGGADAVVIMGYDYRTASSTPVGSVAPIAGPTYDIGDTIRSYLARIPASKVILGVPYYGRAWSTASSGLHARNISGAKYGASTTVVYGTAVAFAADHGRHWDAGEGAAWTVYRRQNCTKAYGCVNPWRELYYDDAQALGLKYDLINHYNLRGAGIWALGYDGTRPELYALLKAKFITDKVPPVISASSLSGSLLSPNGDGIMDTVTVRVTATGLIRYGWVVAPLGERGRRRRDPIGRREREGRRLHLGRQGRQGQGRPRWAVPDHRLDGRRLEQPIRGLEGGDRRPNPGRRHVALDVGVHLPERRPPFGHDDLVDGRRFGRSPGPPASSTRTARRSGAGCSPAPRAGRGSGTGAPGPVSRSPTAATRSGSRAGIGPATGPSATWSSGSTGRSAR